MKILEKEIEIKVLNGNAARKHVDLFYKMNEEAHIAKPTDIFFTAFEDDQCIGTVRFCNEDSIPLLKNMLISKDYRGQGIGKILLEEFQSYLINRNIENTFCIVYTHLDNFYRHIGFQKVNPEEAPQFLNNRLLGFLKDYPQNSYILMKRSGR